MSANASSRNLASEMKSQHSLALHECRLSAPFVPADCTTSQIADVLRTHVPGRRYGPADNATKTHFA
jgi:hypothetical protein